MWRRYESFTHSDEGFLECWVILTVTPDLHWTRSYKALLCWWPLVKEQECWSALKPLLSTESESSRPRQFLWSGDPAARQVGWLCNDPDTKMELLKSLSWRIVLWSASLEANSQQESFQWSCKPCQAPSSHSSNFWLHLAEIPACVQYFHSFSLVFPWSYISKDLLILENLTLNKPHHY